MDVKFKRQPLLEKISLVSGLTEARSPSEVVRNVLLRGSKKRKECVVAATDLESTIITSFKPDDAPAADFDFLAPAQRLLEVVRNIDDEEILLKIQKNNWIEITTRSAQFKLPTFPGKDFPTIPPVSGKTGFSLPPETISNVLPAVLNFSSDDMIRRNINGVLFERVEGMLRLVATDSHRLAYFQKKVDLPGEFESVVLPRKAAGEIAKILRNSEKESGEAAFSFDSEKVFFTLGDTTVISSPVDSPFPEYGRVVPDIKSISPAVIDKNVMLGAVRRVSVFCEDPKKVDIKVSAETVSFNSGETEIGEGLETIPAKFSGTETNTSLNPGFVVDSLNLLDGNSVEFRPGDGNSPAILSLEGSDDVVCILMPVVS